MNLRVPVSAVDSYYNCYFKYDQKNELIEVKEFKLLIGDEKGWVKPQDISAILYEFDIKPAEDVSKDAKRNPFRPLALEEHTLDKGHGNDGISDVGTERNEIKSKLDPGKIKQIHMWEAHSDVIRSIKYINVTDEPLVFTAGLDRMACIWDLEGNLRGKLL